MTHDGDRNEPAPIAPDDRVSEAADQAVDLFDSLTVVAVVLVLLAVVTGLGTALMGAMTPVVFGGLFLAGGVLVVMLVARSGIAATMNWKISVPSAIALLVAAGFSLVSMRYAAEHLLADRDPGVYITTARWLATRGTLLVDGAVGAFADRGGIDGVSAGYYASHVTGLLYPQFQHGLAVILAVGHWIGGDRLLLKAVGLLSGGVIAVIYSFSRTVLRPWWALAATTGIAVNLVMLHFGRDAYSEILLMIFLYGGLWLLNRTLDADSVALSFLTGLVLGGTAMVRIDAWMIVAGVLAFLYFDVWSAGERWRHRLGTVSAPVVAGIAVTGGLGVVDLVVASPQYLHDLMSNVYRIGAVLGIVIGVGILVSVLARPWRWVGSARVAPRRRLIGTGVAVLIVLGSGFLYFIRPAFLVERSFGAVDVIEYLQRLQGLPADGSRRYWEMSMQWQAWYLGVAGLAIGVAGWAWSAREIVIGRFRRLAPFVFVFSIVTVAFLWRPANTPDHLWMMRRFLSITIPGFILLGFVGIQHLGPAVKQRWGNVAAGTVATGLVAAMLIPPAVFAAPLARSTTQVGMYGVTRRVCSALGDDAAVLVVSHQLRSWYEPALRSFCEVPVAGSADLPPLDTLDDVSAQWSASGRELFVASLPVEGCRIDPVFSEFIWYPSPERTLTRRPKTEVDTRFGIVLYRASDVVAAGPGAWRQCADPQR